MSIEIIELDDNSGINVVTDAGTIEARLEAYSAEIRVLLSIAGLKEKLRDGGALSCDKTTGLPASDTEKLAGVQKVQENLLAGNWRKPGKSGPSKKADTVSIAKQLLAALGHLYPKTPKADIEAKVKDLSSTEKATLLAGDMVQKALKEIREATGSAEKGNALLESLGFE